MFRFLISMVVLGLAACSPPLAATPTAAPAAPTSAPVAAAAPKPTTAPAAAGAPAAQPTAAPTAAAASSASNLDAAIGKYYEAAKKEGKLVVYGVGNATLYNPVRDAFMKKF